MVRIFHIPSHLSYANKLVASSFVPVPAPSNSPLTVGKLLALDTWDFFDVLHIHTVEFATPEALTALTAQLSESNKGLVFTVHDLVPNIETDHKVFHDKTELLARRATRVITLTNAAATIIANQFDRRPTVIPHGFAIPPEARCSTLATHDGTRPYGLLAFGALRPNRQLVAMVHAWRRLPPSDRPPLDIVLRSVGPTDRYRYRDQLRELTQAAAGEHDLRVELIDRMLSSDELVQRSRDMSALVLPYSTITHSGQLEFARDVGISTIAPYVETVRAQLAETGADPDMSGRWFFPSALGDPRALARHLAHDPTRTADQVDLNERNREHTELLRAHDIEYRLAELGR